MVAALQGFTTLAIVIGVGWLLARTRVTDRAAQKALGDVAFFAGQPALVLIAVADADLGLLIGSHVAAFGVACIVCGLAFATLQRRVFRASREEAAIGYLATSYVNAGNLGIPIAAFALGDPAWAAPAMLLQVLILQPSAVAVLESSPSGRGRSVVASFATHPLVLAGAAGLVLNVTGWRPPSLLWAPVETIGALAIPAMLLAFGMSLFDSRMPRLHRLSGHTLAAIATKSLLVPAVGWGLGLALGLDGVPLRAAVILAALPTAQIVFVHSLRYQVGVPLVQATTLWSTVLSVPVILLATLLVG